MPPGVVPSNNQQHIIITTQPVSSNQGNEPDDRRMTAFMEYFVDQQQPTGTTLVPAGAYQSSILAGNATTKLVFMMFEDLRIQSKNYYTIEGGHVKKFSSENDTSRGKKHAENLNLKFMKRKMLP
jgi:hypothetical protein